jgi:hypothetical protein
MKAKPAKQQTTPAPVSSEEPLDSDDGPLDSPYPFSEQGIAGPGSEQGGSEEGVSESGDASGSEDIDDLAPGTSDADADVEAGSSGGGTDAEEEAAASGSDGDGPGILGDDSDGDQADREGGSSSSSSSGEEEEDGGDGAGGVGGQASAGPRAGFTEGGKSASFTKAFAKVLGAEAGQDAAILGGSKSLAKRKAEDDAETAERQAAVLAPRHCPVPHALPLLLLLLLLLPPLVPLRRARTCPQEAALHRCRRPDALVPPLRRPSRWPSPADQVQQHADRRPHGPPPGLPRAPS